LNDKYQIDWQKGKILFGFNMLRGIDNFHCTICGDWAPINNTFQLKRSEKISVFGELEKYFKDSDFNIVNIECVIGNKGDKIVKAGLHLKCEKEKLNILKNAPFHLACLANNHVRDYSDEGLINTILLLRKAGLNVIGAGKNKLCSQTPFKLQNDYLKLAIINAAEGESALPINNGAGVASFDILRIASQIKKLKKESFFVIGIFHVGREYIPVPPPYIYEYFHFLADSGIDMIVGHHPHVVQGIEIYNNVPIFYSIGNFLFFQKQKNPFNHFGVILRCCFSGKKLHEIKMIPFKIHKQNIEYLNKIDRKDFFNHIKILSVHLNNDDVSEFWNYYCNLYDVEDILLSKKLKKAKRKEYYARIINRIETPAHRNLILSSARIKINGLKEYSRWVEELCLKYKIRVKEKNIIKKFFYKTRKALKISEGSRTF